MSQFFTPEAAVRFMFDLVDFNPLWKVMDPACGDGAFMRIALERGAAAVAGIDKDPGAIGGARQSLRAFDGRYCLYCQDGLDEVSDASGFWAGHYDLVIGNPPFASSKNRIRENYILRNFTLAQTEEAVETLVLPGLDKELHPFRARASQVIEVLFLERFIRLAKPGGKVAIILPEGIFANSNLRYVREWLVNNFTVRVIVGLPRETFKETGTMAKTAILYLEKKRPPADHMVLLSEVTEIDLHDNNNPQLAKVLQAFGRSESEGRPRK